MKREGVIRCCDGSQHVMAINAAGDLTYFERLDAEPSRAGRSPSVYAKWKDMPVVAKRVVTQLQNRGGGRCALSGSTNTQS